MCLIIPYFIPPLTLTQSKKTLVILPRPYIIPCEGHHHGGHTKYIQGQAYTTLLTSSWSIRIDIIAHLLEALSYTPIKPPKFLEQMAASLTRSHLLNNPSAVPSERPTLTLSMDKALGGWLEKCRSNATKVFGTEPILEEAEAEEEREKRKVLSAQLKAEFGTELNALEGKGWYIGAMDMWVEEKKKESELMDVTDETKKLTDTKGETKKKSNATPARQVGASANAKANVKARSKAYSSIGELMGEVKLTNRRTREIINVEAMPLDWASCDCGMRSEFEKGKWTIVMGNTCVWDPKGWLWP